MSTGSQQVNDVVMVAEMAENLELRHQSLPFLRVSACCGQTGDTLDHTTQTIRCDNDDNDEDCDYETAY